MLICRVLCFPSLLAFHDDDKQIAFNYGSLMTERTFWMGEQSLKATLPRFPFCCVALPLARCLSLSLSCLTFSLVNPVTPRAPQPNGRTAAGSTPLVASVGCRTRARGWCDACPPRGDVAPPPATVPLRISCVHSSPVGAMTRTHPTMRHTSPPLFAKHDD